MPVVVINPYVCKLIDFCCCMTRFFFSIWPRHMPQDISFVHIRCLIISTLLYSENTPVRMWYDQKLCKYQLCWCFYLEKCRCLMSLGFLLFDVCWEVFHYYFLSQQLLNSYCQWTHYQHHSALCNNTICEDVQTVNCDKKPHGCWCAKKKKKHINHCWILLI